MAHAERVVLLTNPGLSAKRVESFTVSCGCTRVDARPDLIPGGGSLAIRVVYEAAPRPGSSSSGFITAVFDSGEVASLRVTGRSVLAIAASPDEVGGGITPATVRLQSRDDRTFRILGSRPEGVVSPDAAPSLVKDAAVDLAGWRAAGSPAFVAVLTDHPGCPAVPLKIVDSQPPLPTLRAVVTPQRVEVDAPAPDDSLEVVFVVTPPPGHGAGQVPEVIKAPPGWILTAAVWDDAHERCEVRLQLSEGRDRPGTPRHDLVLNFGSFLAACRVVLRQTPLASV